MTYNHKNTETESVVLFLRGIVQSQKRDRYSGYLSSKKGRKKLLAALDHDLERDIESKKVMYLLTESEWQSAALLLSSSGCFQTEFESVRKAYYEASWEGGWLIVGCNGRCGIYRPEGRSDGEVFLKL